MSETPTDETPWVRVRSLANGAELDVHYTSPDADDETRFVRVEGYPLGRHSRPEKLRTDLAGEAKGPALAEALEAAGLTEQAKGLSAGEKRALLVEHEASELDTTT